MTPDDIRLFLEAKPFVRFNLQLTNGESYEVAERSQVTFAPSGRVLVYAYKGQRKYIALSHIVCISGGGTPFFRPDDPFFERGR